MKAINTTHGELMNGELMMSNADIANLLVVCDDNDGSNVIVVVYNDGYLVWVDGGDYAYWSSDINVAIRLWMSYQYDGFWSAVFEEFGGEPDSDGYITLHK